MFYPLLSRLDPVKTICFVLFLLTGSLLGGIRAGATEENPLRVLIITGGHHFERTAFFAMFEAMAGIEWTEAVQPRANDLYTPQEAAKYDVIVFYDFVQEITEGQKKNLVRLLREDGKGLVGLHHCIGDYQSWPEFRRILGGRYYLSKRREKGTEYQPGEFLHDQRFRVKITLQTYPVTDGLEDFEIEDETYKGFYVNPDVTKLLGVSHPTSGPVVGWEHEYGKARVVYIQPGHGPSAYANTSYRRLIENALYWVGRRKR